MVFEATDLELEVKKESPWGSNISVNKTGFRLLLVVFNEEDFIRIKVTKQKG